MSMQVDRINQQSLFWSGKYVNPNSKEYKTLEGESNYAVSMTESLRCKKCKCQGIQIKRFPIKVQTSDSVTILNANYFFWSVKI